MLPFVGTEEYFSSFDWTDLASSAFGAPIGGVLFSYEEISTYFPRRVLWRAFLCSLSAAVVLKMLNPTGTGRLVLFETHYGASYNLSHYLVFVLLGIVGGLFGGAFCRLNYLWSKWFRSFSVIKNNPVLEVALVVLATTLLQYPNPLTRDPNDVLISNLFVDCQNQTPASSLSDICHRESHPSQRTTYLLLLAAGTLTKLLLTIITFGTKVPSGVIIPALAAGALFGRFTSLVIPSALAPPPGLAALVGAAAFLAGVSRMTISLCAIMFELTGELDATLPHMVAILVAKWTADSMGRQSVYDLAQSVLGHPFLDHESALGAVQKLGVRAEELIPPARTMEEITVVVPLSGRVRRGLLEEKRAQLEARGLLDAGLVLVRERAGSAAGDLQGYIAQGELIYGLASIASESGLDGEVRVLGGGDGEDDGVADISAFVDRTPVSVCAQAPMEYVVEMFGKLGLRYLMVTEEGSGALVGVVIKKVSDLFFPIGDATHACRRELTAICRGWSRTWMAWRKSKNYTLYCPVPLYRGFE
jgi:chloride channel 3/4/5